MANKPPRRPLWEYVVFLILIEIVYVFVFATETQLENVHAQEMKMLESQLGESAYERMQHWAEKWFKAAFVDTGARESSVNYFAKKDDPRDPWDDRGVGAWMQKRTGVLWRAIHYGLYRWAMLLLWSPLLLIAVLPVTLDAACKRDIKKYQFSYASPLKHKSTSWWIWRAIPLLILTVPLLPFAMPPLAIPVAMMLGLGAWWVFWANMQKRL